MKKLTKIIAAITLLLLFVACGSSKKGCGFTAQSHQIENTNKILI
jgi:hypothetical protein